MITDALIVTHPAALSATAAGLQRRGGKPRGQDCRRLNIVIRYMKRHKVVLFYGKLQKPWKLVAFSDAAFRAMEEESSGLSRVPVSSDGAPGRRRHRYQV